MMTPQEVGALASCALLLFLIVSEAYLHRKAVRRGEKPPILRRGDRA